MRILTLAAIIVGLLTTGLFADTAPLVWKPPASFNPNQAGLGLPLLEGISHEILYAPQTSNAHDTSAYESTGHGLYNHHTLAYQSGNTIIVTWQNHSIDEGGPGSRTLARVGTLSAGGNDIVWQPEIIELGPPPVAVNRRTQATAEPDPSAEHRYSITVHAVIDDALRVNTSIALPYGWTNDFAYKAEAEANRAIPAVNFSAARNAGTGHIYDLVWKPGPAYYQLWTPAANGTTITASTALYASAAAPASLTITDGLTLSLAAPSAYYANAPLLSTADAALQQKFTQRAPGPSDLPSGWSEGKSVAADGHNGLAHMAQFRRRDGTWTIIRDNLENGGYYYAASTAPNTPYPPAVRTNFYGDVMPAAGTLSDGRAWILGNNHNRTEFYLTLSDDGIIFDRSWSILTLNQSVTPGFGKSGNGGPQYPSALLINDTLWIFYSIAKEQIGVTRIPLSSLDDNRLTLLAETFPNDTRSSQNPPDSAAWFTESAVNLSADSATRTLVLTPPVDGTASAVAYVPSVRLPSGDTLTLTCDITLPDSATVAGADSLILALLNTKNTAGNRITADGPFPATNTSVGYSLGLDPGSLSPALSSKFDIRKCIADTAPLAPLKATGIVNETFPTPVPAAAPWRPTSSDSLTWYSSIGFFQPNAGMSQNGSTIRFRAGGYIVTQFDRISIANPGDSLSLKFYMNITDNGDAGATTITRILAGLFDSHSTGAGPDTATTEQIQNNTFTSDGNPTNISSLGLIAGVIDITQSSATAGIWLRNSASNALFTRHASANSTTTMNQGVRGNGWMCEVTCTHLDTGFVKIALALSQDTGGGVYTTKHTMSYAGLRDNYTFDTLAIDIGRAANFMDLDGMTLELIKAPVAIAASTEESPALSPGATYHLEFELARTSETSAGLFARLDGGDLGEAITLQGADSSFANMNATDFVTFDTLAFITRNSATNGGFPSLRIANITLWQTLLAPRPEITRQPKNMYRGVSTEAIFTIEATGDGLGYQWYKDGVPIGGATGSSYMIASTTLGDTGSYTCVVTNAAQASVTSAAAILQVSDSPYPEPVPDGFAAGVIGGGGATAVTVTDAATFKAQAEAAGRGVVIVSGQITLDAPVSIASEKTIQGTDGTAMIVGGLVLPAGTDDVIIRGLSITNPNGTGIAITGATNVFITHCSVLDCAGQLVSLSHSANNVTFSWNAFYYTATAGNRSAMKIGDPVVETHPINASIHHNWWSQNNLTDMPLVAYGNVHLFNNYFVTPGNDYGTIASDWSELLVENNVYQEMSNPLAKVQVEASLPPGKIRAMGNLFVRIAPAGDDPDAGMDTIFTPDYSYIMKGAGVMAESVYTYAGNIDGAASFTPILQGRAASVSGPPGIVPDRGSFTLAAQTSPGDLVVDSYQWRFKNADIVGATSAVYSVTGARGATHSGDYTVALGLPGGEIVVSSPLYVQVDPPPLPVITAQPADQITTAGANASFSVTVSASVDPIAYQWQKNGQNIPGATAGTLRLEKIPSVDNGSAYQVILTNAGGSVTSRAATLTVIGEQGNPGGGGDKTGGGGGMHPLWFLGAIAILVFFRQMRLI
jgi:pectate lyase